MARASLDPDRRLGRRLTLRDLQIMIHVVQLGSMAKAAAHLAISQPTVSQAIVDLEDAVGVRLLDRGPKGVVPTMYGEIFLKRGLEAFDALKQGMRDIERIAMPGSGDIWIGSSDTWLCGFVPAIIQRLGRRHPHVVVHTSDANASDADFHKLRERRLDLMIGRVAKSRLEDDLSVEILYEEPLHVVAGVHYHWADRRKVTLAQLAKEAWTFSEPANLITSLASEAFRANGLELPRASVVTYSMWVILPLLASGKYLTVLPDTVVRYCGDQWSLKILPIDLAIRSPVGIFTLKNRTLTPIVQLFIEEARSEAGFLKATAKVPSARMR
jgi:DNA-binding transcriptional LysR family regulator